MQKLHIQTMVAIVMFMYMAAVNIMIVKYMYKRYELKNKMARLAFDREPVPVEVRRVSETVRSTPQTATCDESRSLGLVIAFVDETSSVHRIGDRSRHSHTSIARWALSSLHNRIATFALQRTFRFTPLG